MFGWWPYDAPNYPDLLRNYGDFKEVSAQGPFKMSHFRMITFVTGIPAWSLNAFDHAEVKDKKGLLYEPN